MTRDVGALPSRNSPPLSAGQMRKLERDQTRDEQVSGRKTIVRSPEHTATVVRVDDLLAPHYEAE